MYEFNPALLPLKTRQFALATPPDGGALIPGDVDLVVESDCAKAANLIRAAGAGLVWIVEEDGHGQQVALAAGAELCGRFRELALGIAAVKLCTGGTYPAVLAAQETIVLRLDEGTIKDTGDVTVTFAVGSYTLAAIIAAINAALEVALGLEAGAISAAANASGQLQITGRAHGSAAKVEVVSIGATLATATGLSVATTAGATTGAASGVLVQW